MPEQMFRTVTNAPVTLGARRWYTVPLSILAHAVAIGAVIVVPLMASGVLPSSTTMMLFTISSPPPPAPPPPPSPQPAQPAAPIVAANLDAAPIEAPHSITEAPPPTSLGVQHGVPGGTPANVGSSTVSLSPPPPPAPPAFVRPGGDIKEPRKIVDVRPIYPPVALAAKLEGSVILEATISKNGGVIDLVVLRSQPLFDQAALDAVRQWKFTPTLLNGEPVDVKMTVTVNFGLAR